MHAHGVLRQLEKRALKLKENKAEEDSLRETRDELTQRLSRLENVTAAGKQVCKPHTRYSDSADAVVNKHVVGDGGTPERIRAPFSLPFCNHGRRSLIPSAVLATRQIFHRC